MARRVDDHFPECGRHRDAVLADPFGISGQYWTDIDDELATQQRPGAHSLLEPLPFTLVEPGELRRHVRHREAVSHLAGIPGEIVRGRLMSALVADIVARARAVAGWELLFYMKRLHAR